jgi:acetolactate synthase-1/2/3 large subunit
VEEKEGNLALVFEPRFSCFPALRSQADIDEVRHAARVLSSARRPVIVAGGGVVASMAQPEIVELAEKLGIPVATSLNAKGTIAEDHRLSVGVVGSYARKCANQVVSEADLVLYLGSRTGSQVTNSWQAPPRDTPVVQLDIAPDELGRHHPNVASLCGDAKAILRQLLELLQPREPNEDWIARTGHLIRVWRSENESHRRSDLRPIRPERICREIQEFLPPDAIQVSDTGHANFWAGAYFELQSGQTFMRANGSLGWALPAAIGAKSASPERPVVCFTGDGGFYYHMAELETAARYGINILIVVNDNHSLDQETAIFAQAYGGRQEAGFEMGQFKELDLAQVARAMGCYGERVERPDEIRPALDRAFRSDRPAVVDIASDIAALAQV